MNTINIQSLKIDLIQWLAQLQDEKMLLKLNQMRKDNLDPVLKELYTKRALEAREEINSGEFYSIEEAEKILESKGL